MEETVQIYQDEDLLDTVMDTEKVERWHELVKTLGLVGQTTVVKDGKSPVPFMLLNDRFTHVLETLCPRKIKSDLYDKGPIPLKVLEALKFIGEEKFFNYTEVWYDDKAPDPFLVGFIRGTRVKSWFYNVSLPPKELHGKPLDSLSDSDKALLLPDHIEEYEVGKYLIARWGDVKKSLIELTELAKERYRKIESESARQRIRDEERKLSDLDHKIAEYFPI